MSLPPSELTLQSKDIRAAVPQCSIVPDNMDRFAWGMAVWWAKGALDIQGEPWDLWGRCCNDVCETASTVVKDSRKIPSTKSVSSHCTYYLLGENSAFPITPKLSSQSSAITYQQLERHLLKTSLSLLTYPLEDPALVWLTHQSLFTSEGQWGWRGNSHLLLSS